MPQETNRGRKVGCTVPMRATLARAAICVAALGFAFLSATAAHADDDSSAWSKFMQTLGLKKSPDGQIHYTERSPLVVPPTRDLPPPGTAADAAPAPDWPKDPNLARSKQSKANAIAPGSGPMQNPNPAVDKRWYNPASWFSKEEYGTFAGEPVRANLTDPPFGYRTPSPSQPYGIGPEDKKTKATANDLHMTPIGGQSGGK